MSEFSIEHGDATFSAHGMGDVVAVDGGGTNTTVSIIHKGEQIRYPLYGEKRAATGISEVILEPVADSFRAEIGTVVEYRVVEIRREVIER